MDFTTAPAIAPFVVYDSAGNILTIIDVNGIKVASTPGVVVAASGKITSTAANGTRIELDPTLTQPTLHFFSPDGTNDAYINTVSVTGPKAADLGVNSGRYTPADGVQRRMRLYLADSSNSGSLEVIEEATQARKGGFFQVQHDAMFCGFHDATYDNFLSIANNGAFLSVPLKVMSMPGNVIEDWHNAALLNGWTVSGSSNGMRYRKVASPPNSVEIRGVITSPNPYNQVMFNVPAPYRPVAQQAVWAWTGSLSGQLAMIQPNGNVPGFGNSGVATDWWIAGTYPLD